MIGNGCEVNRRFVLEGINLFCNVMDISKGFAKNPYKSLNNKLNVSCKRIFDFCCKKAVQEAIAENEK